MNLPHPRRCVQRTQRGVAVAVVLVAWLMSGPRAAVADPIIGERAPSLAAQKLDDAVLLVDFFATWCGPCHEAMAALDVIARRRNVHLVIVDVGEPAATVNAWFAAHPPPPGTAVVIDAQGEAARRWGQHRFPTTFILGGGIIRHINRGYGGGYALRVDHWVTGLQAAPPATVNP